MNLRYCFFNIILGVFLLTHCTSAEQPQQTSPEITVDREQLVSDIRTLSSDEFGGRFPGTEGSLMAQELIIERFESLGLKKVGDDFRHFFNHTNLRNNRTFEDAVNVIGWIEGSVHPERFIAITAHYDHLGMHNGEIYNGADDNASGVGGLLAAAAWFSEHQPENSMLFLALDVEEQGLGGARYFVENPAVPLESIIMNVNMDMISLNHDNELVAAGTYHYPFLRPLIEAATADAPVNIRFGHDSPDLPPGDDWTFSSDHGPFHSKGIPFIYFGVVDHPYYHTPQDVFENITPEFYYNAVKTIIGTLRHLDNHLDEVVAGRLSAQEAE